MRAWFLMWRHLRSLPCLQTHLQSLIVHHFGNKVAEKSRTFRVFCNLSKDLSPREYFFLQKFKNRKQNSATKKSLKTTLSQPVWNRWSSRDSRQPKCEVNFRKTSSGFKDASNFNWCGSGKQIFASGFQKIFFLKKSSTISCPEVLEC